MHMDDLNVATKEFDENRRSGLMICGINWGSDPTEPQNYEDASFFSDRRVNNYEYRNRIIRWFSLWGHPLETSEVGAGAFERSVVQTNWWRSQSSNVNGMSIYDGCLKEWGNFEFHLETLPPRLIFFFSVQLLHALNASVCATAAQRLLGPLSPLRVVTHSKQSGEKP